MNEALWIKWHVIKIKIKNKLIYSKTGAQNFHKKNCKEVKAFQFYGYETKKKKKNKKDIIKGNAEKNNDMKTFANKFQSTNERIIF